jgi:glycosyltransferase involved in cell wall biosynthesis
VILLANKNSSCHDAEIIIGWKGEESTGWKNTLFNAWQLYQVCKKHRPDVVHSFSRLLYLYPLLLFGSVPVIKRYGRYISEKSTSLAKKAGGKKLIFVAAARHMITHLSKPEQWNVLYNFVDIDFYTPAPSPGDSLFFLGRIEDIKGVKEAIEVAIVTQNKLIIAGNIQPGHEAYFEKEVKPHLKNPLISYVGPVDNEKKLHYFRESKALLFPIKWEEPFGIVMAESLACGVPVIAFKRGSVPEVVQSGVNGFVVNNVNEMVEAVRKIDVLSPKTVRKTAEDNFSATGAARRYLTLFQQAIVENGK